jgi:hypothetical protein
MKSVFESCMIHAARILFWIAVLTALAAAIPLLSVFGQLGHDLYAQADPITIASAIVMGLGGAVWPFFGAALLWRIDVHWAKRVEVPE